MSERSGIFELHRLQSPSRVFNACLIGQVVAACDRDGFAFFKRVCNETGYLVLCTLPVSYIRRRTFVESPRNLLLMKAATSSLWKMIYNRGLILYNLLNR